MRHLSHPQVLHTLPTESCQCDIGRRARERILASSPSAKALSPFPPGVACCHGTSYCGSGPDKWTRWPAGTTASPVPWASTLSGSRVGLYTITPNPEAAPILAPGQKRVNTKCGQIGANAPLAGSPVAATSLEFCEYRMRKILTPAPHPRVTHKLCTGPSAGRLRAPAARGAETSGGRSAGKHRIGRFTAF